jgi:hypothetical protein
MSDSACMHQSTSAHRSQVSSALTKARVQLRGMGAFAIIRYPHTNLSELRSLRSLPCSEVWDEATRLSS